MQDTCHYLDSAEKILIRKRGMEIQTLSRFDHNTNIFNRFVEGNNYSLFLPADTPFEKWQTGKPFHIGWDDFAPWKSEKYGTIGANHGSPFTFMVSMLRHWYFDYDTGKVLTDDSGNRFIIVAIKSLSEFLIHSDIPTDPEQPFCGHVDGSLYDNGIRLETDSITRVQMPPKISQLSPHCRYNKIELFADGAPLADNVVAECHFAKLIIDSDLCLPDTLLEYIKSDPGHSISPVSEKLSASIHQRFEIVFQARCAYTVTAKCVCHRDLPGRWTYGLLQHYGTSGFEKQEKFIPKLKKYRTDQENIKNKDIDLDCPAEVRENCCPTKLFTRDDCCDPKDLPDKFIDIFSNQGEAQLGVVLGYSLTRGTTGEKSQEIRDSVTFLPPTTKIYPYAIDRANGFRKGESFEIHAYTQYFDPKASKATACYGHFESDGFFLHAEYHGDASEYLHLPRSLSEKKFTILRTHGDVHFPDDKISSDALIKVKVRGRSGFVLQIK